MQVLLTQEVTGLGSAGEIVEVKDGYGRNCLIPQKKALRVGKGRAGRGVKRQVEEMQRARHVRAVRDLDHAREIESALKSLNIVVPMRVGAGGRLFGAVTAGDFADAVRQLSGPEIDRKKVLLPVPAKTAGKHRASVALHPEVTVDVEFEVKPL